MLPAGGAAVAPFKHTCAWLTIRNISFHRASTSLERERVMENHVLHNLCAAVKMYYFCGPCIFLSDTCYRALSLHTRVSLMYSINSNCLHLWLMFTILYPLSIHCDTLWLEWHTHERVKGAIEKRKINKMKMKGQTHRSKRMREKPCGGFMENNTGVILHASLVLHLNECMN